MRTRAYRKEIVMSDSISRLPARPSLEQLQKQAKELLRQYRAGDSAAAERFRTVSGSVTLADAQFILAREYGFESWAKLKHHIEADSAGPQRYEGLAKDFMQACQGDAEALQRIHNFFGSEFVQASTPFAAERLRV